MRFNVLISLTFIASLAVGRAIIPSDSALAPCSELEAFESAGDKLWDAMLSLASKFKARKGRIDAARKGRTEEKAKKKELQQRVRKEYQATEDLPDRKTTYVIPGSKANSKPEYTYSGVDVRRAVYGSHKEADRIKGLSKTQQKKSPLKNFNNYDHIRPKVQGEMKPLKNLKVIKDDPNCPPAKEYPLSKKKGSTLGPARVITQNQDNRHYFKGVISHDQSRGNKDAARNDHFEIKGKKPTN